MEVVVRNRHTVTLKDDIQEGKSIAIISITDPTFSHPEIPEWPELRGVLKLKFHDTDKLDPHFNYVLMDDNHGDQVASFVEKHKDVDVLIVNCDAGISRSSGVAAAILKHLTGDDNQIFNDRRYNPNRYVVKKTREALRRKGPVT